MTSIWRARTVGRASVASWLPALANSANILRSTALCLSGRFRVTMATCSATEMMTRSVMARVSLQVRSVHLPLRNTMMLRSLTEHWNDTISPSCHISVVIVSPGKTGDEKRPSKPTINVWS